MAEIETFSWKPEAAQIAAQAHYGGKWKLLDNIIGIGKYILKLKIFGLKLTLSVDVT